MKLIVGLGNPGQKYKGNRHNIGFMAVDRFAKAHDIELCIRKKKAVFGRGMCDGREIVLLKPQTFMNLSGEAVLYLASFLKIKTKDIITITDDTELPFGKIRIRRSGGHGGHNGIRSLIYSLKSEDFPRLRFGIGRPPSKSEKDLCEYVLEDFTQEETNLLNEKMDEVIEAIRIMVLGSIDEAMNNFNKK
ncbi:MAG: aminoacyl-tRNA hydrolase [Spirochaetes bacterium]|nr:aminoacyl-tRNA hydrolase [Spirochaetota bacterium]